MQLTVFTQELYNTHQDKLQIIGVPSNQFGGQEPGNSETIASFCEVNYGVTFLITEKIDVKGKNQHPLYTWLTQKVNNEKKDSTVKQVTASFSGEQKSIEIIIHQLWLRIKLQENKINGLCKKYCVWQKNQILRRWI